MNLFTLSMQLHQWRCHKSYQCSHIMFESMCNKPYQCTELRQPWYYRRTLCHSCSRLSLPVVWIGSECGASYRQRPTRNTHDVWTINLIILIKTHKYFKTVVLSINYLILLLLLVAAGWWVSHPISGWVGEAGRQVESWKFNQRLAHGSQWMLGRCGKAFNGVHTLSSSLSMLTTLRFFVNRFSSNQE